MNHRYLGLLAGLSLILSSAFESSGQSQRSGVFADDSLMVMARYQQGRARMQYNNGVDALQGNDLQGAIQQFSEAVSLDPAMAEAFYNRAIANLRLKNEVEAMLDFASAIQIEPRPEFYYGRALLSCRRNDLNSALSDLQRANQVDPPVPDIMLGIGVLQYRLGNFPAALDAFARINRSDKQNVLAMNGLAMVYLQLGDTVTALEKLEESLEVSPSQAEVLQLLGELNLDAGRLSEAEMFLRKALVLNDKDCKTLNAMAVLFSKGNQPDSAFLYSKSAVNANPGYPPAWNTSGNIFYQRKEFQRAEADYTMAISLMPEFWYAYYNRALCREMQRNDLGACDDWKKASENGVPEAKVQYSLNCE